MTDADRRRMDDDDDDEWRVAMTQYMLIIPDDYDAWEAMTPQQRADIYAEHEVFAERLAQGGHRVEGGAELTLPRTARTVRSGPEGITVTDGRTRRPSSS